jgi:hypothetical protein
MLSVPTVEYSVLIRLLFVAEVVLWADKELWDEGTLLPSNISKCWPVCAVCNSRRF